MGQTNKPNNFIIYNISLYYPFKDEAQTALFKDPVRTAQ